jgi:plastocyanin
MTRLAGITSLYALIAALLLVTPLSASEDPVPEPAAPEATALEAAPDAAPDAAPQTGAPAPDEAAPPEEAIPSDPASGGASASGGDSAAGPSTPGTSTPGTAVQQAPGAGGPVPAETPATQPAADAAPAAQRSRAKPRRTAKAPRATAAADTGVTISDFQFAPASVTIDVGDTVTWTNEGPTPHSATADDRSFDTGIFEAGQSRSHTFDEAGTFAYFCTPHPNMRGTVTVRAAGTGGGGGGSGGGGGDTGGGSGDGGGGAGGTTAGDSGTTGTGSGTSSDSSGTALPATGLDTGGLALLGLVTLALGTFLRRRAAAE